CGTAGTQACDPARCTWGECVPPLEMCNGVDDDCNELADDGFACVQGTTRDCQTACGTTGTQRCGAACEWESCEPPPELCGNDIDDDCDGATDVTEAAGESRTFGQAGANGTYAIAALGNEYVIGRLASSENLGQELVLSWHDGDGTRLRSEQRTGIAGSALGAGFRLTTGGGAIAVTWRDGTERKMMVVEEGLSAGREPLRLTGYALLYAHSPPPVVWTGNEFLTAVSRVVVGRRSAVRMRRVHREGQLAEGYFQVNEPTDGQFHLDMVWAEDSAGLVWHEPAASSRAMVRFARTDGAELIGAVLEVSEVGENTGVLVKTPTVAFDGESFGIAWAEGEHERGQIRFARASRDEQVGDRRRVAITSLDSRFPRLVWNGFEYGLAWLDWHPLRSVGEIHFVRLRADGRRIGEPIRLAGNARLRPPDLFWDGAQYAVTFSTLETESTIKLARVSCD
ncbi:MAG: hypothetical protein AAGF12_39135, partial [Myxococcota bacterium]